jgi:prophage antirepressor-like protein
MTTETLQNTPLSNNNILIFKSDLIQDSELRVVGTTTTPLFIAKDIAKMLGYKNINRDVNRHVDEEDMLTYQDALLKWGTEMVPLKIQPQTKLINESGFYSLILSSKLSSAKLFKRWVTSEVIPSIRQHGQYKLTQQLQTLTADYEKLRQCHNSLKFKRNYHELEKGDCVYVCHNKLEPPDRYKIGKTNNISKTLRAYRRNSPYTLLDYLFYTRARCLYLKILF